MKETIIKSSEVFIRSVFSTLNWVIATPLRAFTLILLTACLTAIGIVTTVFIDQRSGVGIAIVNAIGEDNFIAKLDETKFNEEITHLIRRSGAAGATLWSVNLAKSTRQVLYSASERFGTEDRKSLIGQEVHLYGDNTENILAIVKMQENHVACFDIHPESDYEIFLKQNLITYVCGISVPPDFGQFAGMITLEFRSKNEVPKLLQSYLTFAARHIVRY